jgi:putative endonuclease
MEPPSFYVYILASRIGGTLYIGVTNDLIRRVAEHKLKIMKGFTKKYGVHKLVYFEQFDDAENAIGREKQLKRYNRAWKIRLIEELNPNWDDLYSGIAGVQIPRHTPRRGVSSITRKVWENVGLAEYWIVRLRGR